MEVKLSSTKASVEEQKPFQSGIYGKIIIPFLNFFKAPSAISEIENQDEIKKTYSHKTTECYKSL